MIHGAGESSPGTLQPGTYAVALHARDEEHLRSIAEFLEENGVAHHLIIENAEAYQGQLMAIGVVPDVRSKLRKYFSTLPLVK